MHSHHHGTTHARHFFQTKGKEGRRKVETRGHNDGNASGDNRPSSSSPAPASATGPSEATLHAHQPAQLVVGHHQQPRCCCCRCSSLVRHKTTDQATFPLPSALLHQQPQDDGQLQQQQQLRHHNPRSSHPVARPSPTFVGFVDPLLSLPGLSFPHPTLCHLQSRAQTLV